MSAIAREREIPRPQRPGFFVGRDVAVTTGAILGRDGGRWDFEVALDGNAAALQHYPPLTDPRWKVSVRSGEAMFGTTVVSGPNGAVFRDVRQDGDDIYATIRVQNLGRRVRLLPPGHKIGRPYFDSGERVEGKDLSRMIGANIFLTGKQGTDWDFMVDPQKGPVGIWAEFDYESYRWAAAAEEPLALDSDISGYKSRPFIDTTLLEKFAVPEENIPSLRQRVHWNADLRSRMTLRGVYVHLERVYTYYDQRNGYSDGGIVESRLIDDGTDIEVRVEGYSDIAYYTIPRRVEMSVVKNSQPVAA